MKSLIITITNLIIICNCLVLFAQTGTLPYSQNFNGTEFPPEEPDWTVRDRGGSGTWAGDDGNAISRSLFNWQPITPDDWLISPSFTFIAGNEYAIQFDFKAENQYYPNDFITIYAMSSNAGNQCVDNNPNNIVLWSGYPTGQWATQTAMFTPDAQTAGVRFIAFRHHNCYGQDAVRLDNISIYHSVANDLYAAELTGPSYYNPNMPYTLNIINLGYNDVLAGAYTVQMFSANSGVEDVALGAIITDTPALASGATANVTIPASDWGFDVPSEAQYEVYAKIVYSEDDTPLNNISNIIQLTVLPSDKIVIDLMPPFPNYTTMFFPVNYYWGSNLSQTIYTAEELGGLTSFGEVYQFVLRLYDFDAPDIPVQFYLANAPATLTSFPSIDAYYPFEHFTLVFEGPLPLGAGHEIAKDLLIPVGTTPGSSSFVYEGENLILMTYKIDFTFYNASNLWHHHPGTAGITRTLHVCSDVLPAPFSPLNPNVNGSDVYSNEEIAYPKVVFFIERGDSGTVSGTVTDATTNAPLEGAKVFLANIPDVFALTDATGAYTLANIPLERDIAVSAFGYYTQHIPYEQIGWNIYTQTAVKDVQLQPLPAGLSISGRVKLGDSGEYTNGITVKLTGYIEAETSTSTYDIDGSSGHFNFVGLYGSQSYTVTIEHPHFHSSAINIELTDSSVDNLDITLIEVIQPPLMVTAEVNPANPSEAIVKWYNPFWGYSSYSHARAGFDQGVGPGTPEVFIVAHRYTSAQIAGFHATGQDIYKVGFIPYDDTGTEYKVKIWVTNNPNTPNPTGLSPICEVAVPEVVIQEVNEVYLPTLVTIPPGGQIFVGYEVVTEGGGFPSALDDLSHLNGYGNLMMYNATWTTLEEEVWIPGSWCIYISEMEPENGAEPAPVVLSNIDNSGAINKRHTPRFSAVSAGYQVNLDNFVLGKMPNSLTRALNGEFEIYRMPSDATIPPEPLHTTTNADISMTNRNMQYIDAGWGSLPNDQLYRYAVKAKHAGAAYEGGYEISAPLYSNNLLKGSSASVTINVVKQGGVATGAAIYLYCGNPEIPNQMHTLQATDNGSHTFSLYMNYAYEVRVILAGASTYANEHIFTLPQNTLTISLLAVNTIFAETFNGLMPDGWSNIDADNDGQSWIFNDIGTPGPGGLFVDTAAYSESWKVIGMNEVVLEPDNWLISPEIELPQEQKIGFQFLVAAQDQIFAFDRLLFYIAPAGNEEPGWQTFLQERNPITGEQGSPLSEVLQPGAEKLDDHTVWPEITNGGFYMLEYDITHFGGQRVRVAFRHAFCENMFQVKIANMLIYHLSYPPVNLSGNVVDELGAPIGGANVQVSSSLPTFTITNSTGAFTIQGIPGNADYTVTIKKEAFIDVMLPITLATDDFNMGTIEMQPDTSSEADVTKPMVTALKANYPNPFNPSTTIAFELARAGLVTIDIYNIKGQRVRALVNELFSNGGHKVVWNGCDDSGRDVKSGVYFYRMVSEGYVGVKKMVMMK